MARDNDEGQMMLLAAVVLILGFVALSGLVARVNQLPAEITRDQADPVFLEIEPLSDFVERMLSPAGLQARGLAPGTQDYENATRDALTHLEALEAGKGFLYSWRLCTAPAAFQVFIESTLASYSAVLTISSDPFAKSPQASPVSCA